MDFKKEERDVLLKALASVTTTFAIMSEPDEKEDGTTQLIRKKVREFTDRLFDMRSEVEQYMENFKDDFEL